MKHYTTREAGELLGLTQGAIIKNIQRGKIKAERSRIRVHKDYAYLIPESEVERYQRERKKPGWPRKEA